MVVRMHSKSKSEAETDSSANEEIRNNSSKIVNGIRVSDHSQTEPVQQASTTDSSISWYRGTWRRGSKATPVTQVAKDSIPAAAGRASSPVLSVGEHVSPGSGAPKRPLSIGSSSRSPPLPATTTKLNITSNKSNAGDNFPTATTDEDSNVSHSQTSSSKLSQTLEKSSSDSSQHDRPNIEEKGSISNVKIAEVVETRFGSGAPSWRGWFSRYNGTGYPAPVDHSNIEEDFTRAQPPSPAQRRNSDPSPTISRDINTESRSWLGLWGGRHMGAGFAGASKKDDTRAADNDRVSNTVDGIDRPDPSSKLFSAGPSTMQPSLVTKSQKWTFWFQDASGPDRENVSTVAAGDLAFPKSPYQPHPETAIYKVENSNPDGKTRSRETLQVTSDLKTVQKPSEPSKPSNSRQKGKSSDPSTSQGKQNTHNLLLPAFRNTYQSLEKPTFIQLIGRLWQNDNHLNVKRVELLPDPPKIKKAIAIGIHGYFPIPLIRTVLGQPTGTSIRFADGAADAIRRWSLEQGYSCEIEKVALEGEGKILERISVLWKLLLNWIENIRQADFLLVACHSAGVPVALMLIAKLIESGHISNVRIGVCAMAGINLGPFADYKSRWIGGSAGELFEFARSDSQVSKDYDAALEVALKFGVRIAYIGSIDDQLVSLESSTFGTIEHPYIYRAVFVDGRVHAPDFLTHLVGFAMKLRNLGISDHGLIRELSPPLAGSLYSGEGHSRIYEDDAVYYLAVQNALETSSVGAVPLRRKSERATNQQNPYILPFSLRGVLEEDYVKSKMHVETAELLQQFDEWKPSSKVLKDVKFRLEGVRSKL